MSTMEEEELIFEDSKVEFDLEPYFTISNSQLNLLKDIRSLIENTDHYDVIVISSDGTQHKAHKAILACRSKVFSAMFEHNMKERQSNKVIIKDIDSETLKEVLQFIYTGEVESIELGKACKLLIAADKYDLSDLRAKCILNICNELQYGNILFIIKFAHAYNINELKLETKKYFLQNHKIIIATNGREFTKNLPQEIMEEFLYSLASYES